MPDAVSYDPRFLAGLVHRAAFDVDRNGAGHAASLRAGIAPDWEPVAGMQSVPCLATKKSAGARRSADRDGEAAHWVVLFGRDVPAGLVTRLRYSDRSGREHMLFPTGPPVDEQEMGHHWVVYADEFVA